MMVDRVSGRGPGHPIGALHRRLSSGQVPGTADGGDTVASSPPRLRRDLVISQQEASDGAVLVVKDRRTGRFYHLRAAERFIAEQLDGRTPLEIVRARTEIEFESELPRERLDSFVAQLRHTGLLEGEATDARSGGSSRRGRIRGSVLYLRFPLFDPDRVLATLARWTPFFFTPAFIAISATAMLGAVGVTVAHHGAIMGGIGSFEWPGAVPLFAAVLLVIISAHEFAHGVTCKRFGGEVREMGFMLIYFQPAFYCNVSDAWLFPEKSRRLWVSAAGGWFELFCWALATLAWWITESDTPVNRLALVMMTVSGVKSLLNLNPLIKLDGYYLLSDYLDIPNLRRKSFRYVGDRLRRLLGSDVDPAPPVTPREHRIFLLYGAVSTLASIALLAYAFVTAGGFLLEMRQPAALGFLTGIIGLRFRSRIRRLFGRRSDPSQADDDDDEGDDGAERDEGRVADKPRRSASSTTSSRSRANRRWKRRFIWGTVAAGVLGVLLLGRMELRIGGPFSILPGGHADIRSAVSGLVEEIVVDEGDTVQAGDLIARLSHRDMAVELRKTEAQLQEARANLGRLRAGPTAVELEVARAGVRRAADRLDYEQAAAARQRSLFEARVASAQELEVAEAQVKLASNDLAEAQSKLNVLLRGTRPEDVAAMRAQVTRLDAQRRYLEDEVARGRIVTTVAGVVATPARQLRAMQGQLVERGTLVARVYDFRTVVAEIVIPEKEIGDVRVGHPVVLRVRAYPDVVFSGTVTAIATAAQGTTTGAEADKFGAAAAGTGMPGMAGKQFVVTSRIGNRALQLKPGMTGYVKVLAGKRRIIDLMARRLARTVKVEVWSWW